MGKLFAEGIEIPTPAGLCEACLVDKQNTLHSARTRCLISYCGHHHTGGIIQLDLGQWTLYTPIDRTKFFELVDAATYTAMKDAGVLDQNAH